MSVKPSASSSSRQAGVGGDSATAELELQAAVEIEPKRPVNRFTRRVRHMPRPKMRSRHCFLMTEPTIKHINQLSHMGNAALYRRACLIANACEGFFTA